MPGGDRTGSMGQDPRTGKGLGYCIGFDSPGFVRGTGYEMESGFGYGRGMCKGRGMGSGRGFSQSWSTRTGNAGFVPRYPWAQPMSKEDEIEHLKSHRDALSRSQKEIEKRLEELEKE